MIVDRLFQNWPLKLVALAVAFGIWVSVTGEKRVIQDLDVPLDIDLPDTAILTVDPPNTVTVRLRGAESLMRTIGSKPIELKGELPDATPGQWNLRLTESNLSGVPRGVEVEFIDPDLIRLEVDRRARGQLPIEPTFLGRPPEGYDFYGAQVAPRQAMVEGPATEVEPLSQVRTDPIRLDRRRQPFKTSVSVVAGANRVRVVNPTLVEVHVQVDAIPVDRVFTGLAVGLSNQTHRSEIKPSVVDVTLSGPPAVIETLDEDQIYVVADVGGLEPSDKPYQLDLSVNYLELADEDVKRLTVKSIKPRRGAVRVHPEPLTP